MGNELGAGANSALSALQTFQALDQVKAQTDLMYAQRDKVDAETLDALEQPAYTRARTGDTKASEEYRKVDTAFQQMRLRLAEETFRDNVSSAHSSAQIARNQAQGGLYDLSKSKVYSDFYNTKIGKEEPLIKLGGEAISNAGDLFGKFLRRGR